MPPPPSNDAAAALDKLAETNTLSLEDSLPWLSHVRANGVRQFISNLEKHENLTADELRWGDEVEFLLLRYDDESRRVQLNLRASQVLAELQASEEAFGRRDGFGEAAAWHPEYAAWMIEGTPRAPFGGYTADLLRVERSMLLRRKRIAAALGAGEAAVTMPAFPLVGVGEFAHPWPGDANEATQSADIPDGVILPNPRFLALTRNIRKRRGSKVDIRVPLAADVNTDPDELADGIRMDAMAYGMGCCCLQVTFQARDIDESRHLYDHLAVLAPIGLALTAATPVLHGRLAATDVRWATISQAVDDRTPAERGAPGAEAAAHPALAAESEAMLVSAGRRRLPKSRYDSISTYIARCSGCQDQFNDIDAPISAEALSALGASGIDAQLARHVAHLFVRDPLTVQEQALSSPAEASEHFESIQSTNWQTVRWKPPPRGKPTGPRIGWRVEFRSMEVQLTDFENAAFTVFVVLVSRVILAFDLNLYIPLSKVDENMARAHSEGAAHASKFFFRRHMAPPVDGSRNPDGYEEMSIVEILNGKGDYYPGLIPLIYAYLDSIECDDETYARVSTYMEFIRKRASGELLTPAQWMRKFVTEHPDYRGDSVVPESVAYDLTRACVDIGEGRRHEPELLGDERVPELRTDDAWYVPLRTPSIQGDDRKSLLARYAGRVAAAKARRDAERGARASKPGT